MESARQSGYGRSRRCAARQGNGQAAPARHVWHAIVGLLAPMNAWRANTSRHATMIALVEWTP